MPDQCAAEQLGALRSMFGNVLERNESTSFISSATGISTTMNLPPGLFGL